MNGGNTKRRLVLALMGLMGMAGLTVHAQYSNELELRGVRSYFVMEVSSFLFAAITNPDFEDIVLLSEENKFSVDDYLFISETEFNTTNPDGSTTTTNSDGSVTTTSSDGSSLNGIDIQTDLRTGREKLDVHLFLAVLPGHISDVFVGRSSRTTFLVYLNDDIFGRVRLSRVDLDGDGLADGVLQELIDPVTGGVTAATITEYGLLLI